MSTRRPLLSSFKARDTLLIFGLLYFSTTLLFPQVKTRTEEIELERREKLAILWPERESPMVDTVEGFVERGLLEGAKSGKGANGWQFVLGGMRPGQGASFGLGYRRSDLFRDRIGVRATGRGTLQKSYMFDIEVELQELSRKKSYLSFYTKYENSPQMDYYGVGFDSVEDNRTSYRFEDTRLDLRGGYEFLPNFVVGGNVGSLFVHTGRGTRSKVPSTEDLFPSVAGLNEDTTYFHWGGDVFYDWRDNPNGPRSGGLYKVSYDNYRDIDRKKYTFNQWYFEAAQFIPYFNKSRVIAFRVNSMLSFPKDDNRIPFYGQPKLGGNDSLRGFELYRFYDDHALMMTVEHRWHSFSGLDMALFVDAGKVASRKADLDFSDLAVSYGIGFRFKFQDSVFMRIDFAAGREGFRFMWTFNDIFTKPFE